MVAVDDSTLVELLRKRLREANEVRAHKDMLHHMELPIERHRHAPLITSDGRLARAASAYLPVEVFA